jgi:2-aminoadipate transaminase
VSDPYVSIQLERRHPLPLYQQLYLQLKDAILSGKLQNGQKLDPIRRLAARLGVNTVTVVQAFRCLEREGLVYAQVGRGTFVASPGLNSVRTNTRVAADSTREIKHDRLDSLQVPIAAESINFATLTPAADLFPVDDFRIILNQVLDRDRGQAFGYQESQGYYPLRCSVASYLAREGIDCHAESIQVISGAQQGIDIIARSLLQRGDYVVTESPTYTGALASFHTQGARILAVPLQADGINLETLYLQAIKQRPKLMYVMTNFQNPTGSCYSIEKQQALLELCRKLDMYLIEDDSFTELSYDGRERRVIKEWDQDDRVIYIKSFSKILMPGLRLAFLLAPQKLLPQLMTAKHTADISTSGLLQRAFDLYLRQGLWKTHLAYMKKRYRGRYQNMLEAMRLSFPAGVDFQAPQGGLCIWVQGQPGLSANRLYEACLADKVVIAPGSLFYPDNHDSNQFRLSFAALTEADISNGIPVIARHLNMFNSPNSDPRHQYSPLL